MDNLNSIISFDDIGISKKTKEQIFQMLAQKIFDLYGIDITLNEGDADIIYQTLIAEILDDFADVAINTYGMLDIQAASGVRLDYLTSLFGVFRYTNANIRPSVYNIQLPFELGEFTFSEGDRISILDQNDVTWFTKKLRLTQDPNDPEPSLLVDDFNNNSGYLKILKYVPGALGDVQTTSRFKSANIIRNNNSSVQFQVKNLIPTVNQLLFLGRKPENDDELRERWMRVSMGNNSKSLLESLKGVLISTFREINDIKVYVKAHQDVVFDNSEVSPNNALEYHDDNDDIYASDLVLNKHDVLIIVKPTYGSENRYFIDIDGNPLTIENKNKNPLSKSILISIRDTMPIGIGTILDSSTGGEWNAGEDLPITQPVSPSSGDMWFDGGENKIYTYNGTSWDSGEVVSITEPVSPVIGSRWFNTTSEKLFTYVFTGFSDWGTLKNYRYDTVQDTSDFNWTETFAFLIAEKRSPKFRITIFSNEENANLSFQTKYNIFKRINEAMFEKSKSYRISQSIVTSELYDTLTATNLNIEAITYRVSQIEVFNGTSYIYSSPLNLKYLYWLHDTSYDKLYFNKTSDTLFEDGVGRTLSVPTTIVSDPEEGDIWFNESEDTLYRYINGEWDEGTVVNTGVRVNPLIEIYFGTDLLPFDPCGGD